MEFFLKSCRAEPRFQSSSKEVIKAILLGPWISSTQTLSVLDSSLRLCSSPSARDQHQGAGQ